MPFFPSFATVCPLFTELAVEALLTALVASFCAVFGSLKFDEKAAAFYGELSSKLYSVDVFSPVAPPPSALSRQLSISWNVFCTEICCFVFLVFAPPCRGMPWRDFGLKTLLELLGIVLRK